MEFHGDIIITDPCYIVKNSGDWGECEYGQDLNRLSIPTFLSTGYEDCGGSFAVYSASGETLGKFCSDSCVVSVMDLAELTAYNPQWSEKLSEYCCTVIRNFHGEVRLISAGDDGQDSWSLWGEGNFSFRTEPETR